MAARHAVQRLFAAIESRDVRAIADALTPDATWQNVPHPPAVGRDAVLALLAPIVTWSDSVAWDVVSAGYDGATAWVERVDRFVIGGTEHAVRCHGVFTTREGQVAGVRDYVDLGEWRARIGPVYAALRERAPIDVVRRHLAAVAAGDPVAMAADYALDAELVRGANVHRGWRAIADYFHTVPDRLAGRNVEFDPPVAADDGITVTWSIGDTSGRDTYTVEQGRITHQSVELHGPDF